MLERNPEPESNRAPAIDAFLTESIEKTPEVVVGVHIRNEWLQRAGINSDIEISKHCKRSAAAAVVTVGRPQRMIEEIINIGAQCGDYSLAESEVLMDAKVYAPRARTLQ